MTSIAIEGREYTMLPEFEFDYDFFSGEYYTQSTSAKVMREIVSKLAPYVDAVAPIQIRFGIRDYFLMKRDGELLLGMPDNLATLHDADTGMVWLLMSNRVTDEVEAEYRIRKLKLLMGDGDNHAG